jgi:hypothetical protein
MESASAVAKAVQSVSGVAAEQEVELRMMKLQREVSCVRAGRDPPK